MDVHQIETSFPSSFIYISVITLRVIFKASIFRVCLVVSVFYLYTKEAVQGVPRASDVSRGKTFSKPSNLVELHHKALVVNDTHNLSSWMDAHLWISQYLWIWSKADSDDHFGVLSLTLLLLLFFCFVLLFSNGLSRTL